MNDLNVVIIEGIVIDKEESKFIDDIISVNFQVQSNDNYDYQIHDCIAWGRLAEVISCYVKKGQHVCISGRLKTKPYKHIAIFDLRFLNVVIVTTKKKRIEDTIKTWEDII